LQIDKIEIIVIYIVYCFYIVFNVRFSIGGQKTATQAVSFLPTKSNTGHRDVSESHSFIIL